MNEPARPPLLLLDVDGVLNAVSHRGDRTVWSDWEHGEASNVVGRFPILYSPTVAAAVRRWHEDGLAEVRWLTTWLHDANGELRHLLGLPAFPVLGAAQYQGALRPSAGAGVGPAVHADVAGARAASALSGRWWKFDAVLELVADQPGRALVWIDDDLPVEPGIAEWMGRHTTSLLVAPRTHLGLTPRQLATVQDWLLGHAPGRGEP